MLGMFRSYVDRLEQAAAQPPPEMMQPIIQPPLPGYGVYNAYAQQQYLMPGRTLNFGAAIYFVNLEDRQSSSQVSTSQLHVMLNRFAEQHTESMHVSLWQCFRANAS